MILYIFWPASSYFLYLQITSKMQSPLMILWSNIVLHTSVSLGTMSLVLNLRRFIGQLYLPLRGVDLFVSESYVGGIIQRVWSMQLNRSLVDSQVLKDTTPLNTQQLCWQSHDSHTPIQRSHGAWWSVTKRLWSMQLKRSLGEFPNIKG